MTRRDEGEPAPPLDPERIFATLNRHGVDYVVIGGIAVIRHGHIRATGDVDFVADESPGNLRRLAAALDELNARLQGVDSGLLAVDPTDPEDLAAGANWTMVCDAGRLHFFAQASGAPPYSQLADRSVRDQWRRVEIRIVGLDDLIRMKRTAGRDRDLRDIAALTTELDDGAAGGPAGG